MADDHTDTDKPKGAAKKGATKKPPARETRALRYVVNEGRSLSIHGRGIIGAGESVTADEVSDLEALVKGGFVVKA